MRRHRLVIAIVSCGVLAVIVGLVDFAGTGSLQHRLGQSESLGGARLDPPSIWSWPRLSYPNVLSHCDFCNHEPSSDVANRTVQLGWLVSDETLAGLVSTNAPNRPTSSAEVPLPRLVWVVRWQSGCTSTPPPGFHGCITYDIIDDATGLELDTAQAWR
jgi:hypothetical protein